MKTLTSPRRISRSIYAELNLCKPGGAVRLIDEGITTLTGKMPVNPSRGLAAKGHPISATGLAQIHEIALQLRGEAGQRQVTNDPKMRFSSPNAVQE